MIKVPNELAIEGRCLNIIKGTYLSKQLALYTIGKISILFLIDLKQNKDAHFHHFNSTSVQKS